MMRQLRCLVAGAAVLMGGCATHSSSSLPPQQVALRGSTVSFIVKVPIVAAGESSRIARPMFIASTSASISITIISTTSNSTVVSQSFAIGANVGGCVTGAASLTCTEMFVLPPDSYRASIVTYDVHGAVLGRATNVAFTALLGVTNVVPLTLYGVPHSLTLQLPGTPSVTGTVATGLTFYGRQSQTLVLNAADADGNTIVGAGVPAAQVTSTSGSGFAIGTSAGSPSFTLTPTSHNANDQFTVSAVYSDPGICTQPGAVCSLSLSAVHRQLLFIGMPSGVAELAPPYAVYTPVPALAGFNPSWVCTDGQGRLFAGNNTRIEVLAPPYSAITASVTVSGLSGLEFAVDSAGDIFAPAAGLINEFVPPWTSSRPIAATGGNTWIAANGAIVAALDSAGHLNVINASTGTLAGSISTTVVAGGYAAVAIDDAGNVYTLFNGRAVRESGPPYSGSSDIVDTNTLTYTNLYEIGVSHGGSVFASPQATTPVLQYAAPLATSTLPTQSTGIVTPIRFAFDIEDNLYAYDGTALYFTNGGVTTHGPAVPVGTTASLAITP